MKKPQFVVIGSGGGGGTIAWMLAKAGHSVVVLEQGPDLADQFKKAADAADPPGFNRAPHDEYFYRVKRPDPKRRPRGDYNTFRRQAADKAVPFKNGWTGSVLGGGSVLWGTWAFRALPVDFKLKTVFDNLVKDRQSDDLSRWGYSLADWPMGFDEMEPFYNVAEALLAVSGDRQALVDSIKASAWFEEFSKKDWFTANFPAHWWEPRMEFPCPPYPRTPVGQFVFEGMDKAGMHPFTLPTAIVAPGTSTYKTQSAIARALQEASPGGFWDKTPEEIWSERVRQACNMCGFCGEFLCWGGARPLKEGDKIIPGAPKSGTHSTVLQELRDMQNAGKPVEIICNAKAFEVLYDEKKRRATGVRWLDVSIPDKPAVRTEHAEFVIVSCGAVQSARLLWMSGPSRGLGNQSDHLGRHACFHLFGLAAAAVLKPEFQSLLHGEFGFTGNTTSFAPYFIQDPVTKRWYKSGTLTSTARKNPLERALERAEGSKGLALLKELDLYNRSLEVRLTADDLPMRNNRVDLDPTYVDEYGFPVARVTRDVGMHEWLMYARMVPELQRIFDAFKGAVERVSISPHIADLIGDHQMGTCRMGDKPGESVINRWGALHEAKNLFVVDSSFMPTGLGLNPMVTVVANALRVGTHIVDRLKDGKDPGD